MKSKLAPSIALGVICLVVAALLAIVNSLTAPKINQNKIDAAKDSLSEVLKGHEGFESIKITDGIPASITMIEKSSAGGYVFSSTVSGKSSGFTVLIGISPDGKISGTKCTSNSETPSYAQPVFEKTENEQWYAGKDAESFEKYLVSGSTLTSEAYATAVQDALKAFAILTGGDA